MGNQPSLSSSSNRHKTSFRTDIAAERVKKVVGEVHEEIKRSVKKFDDDHPAAQFFDSVCGGGAYYDDEQSQASSRYYRRKKHASSFYSEDDRSEDDGSRTVSEDDTTAYDDQSRRSRADKSVESQSYISQSDNDSDHRRNNNKARTSKGENGRQVTSSFDTEEDTRTEASSTVATNPTSYLQKQPLASSFARRCYFTKSGIGRTTQHYEGLTLTGNVVLMLASAMKLKGCPTICDEDLRRVEQTYPNQFSRLPDELLLSSGWRRISKYCHFSNKPIPDGVPFFHSKQRLHPSGGYYFLLAAAVGMTRPMDVEPISRDTLVLLETDYPAPCDSVPSILIKDHEQWTLVNKFCFFSGGPINTEEDVYYQADFDGNPIYMLAFLSPSLTPEELYKLGESNADDEPSLQTIAAVEEVESVYDLTERDFDDLKLYHLGPCRALPQYILSPQAWVKILPPHFLAARQKAMARAEEYMRRIGIPIGVEHEQEFDEYAESAPGSSQQYYSEDPNVGPMSPGLAAEFQREMKEEGTFHDEPIPIDEARGHMLPSRHHPNSPNGRRLDGPPAAYGGGMMYDEDDDAPDPATPKLDPPDDEPPSLHKAPVEFSTVADPEDPSMMLSPPGIETPTDLHGHTFFAGNSYHQRGRSSSPSKHPTRSYPEPHSSHDGAMSPEDENRSTNLISLGSPDEQPHLSYDPFDNHNMMTMQNNSYNRDQFDYRQQYQQQQQQQLKEEAEPSIHYRPRSNVRSLDPLYTEKSPTHSDLGITPHYQHSSPARHADAIDYGDEEKKAAPEEPERMMRDYQQMSQDSNIKSGDNDDFNIMHPPQRHDYGDPESNVSPQSVGSGSSHQSAAFRSAQEVLRRNRRKRIEDSMKNGSSDPLEHDRSPPSPTVHSHGTWEEGSDLSGSNASGSSLWSEGSSTGDRSSRRALILQMAKARMRNNTTGSVSSPSKMPSPQNNHREPSIVEEEMSLGGYTEGNNTEFDISGDLD